MAPKSEDITVVISLDGTDFILAMKDLEISLWKSENAQLRLNNAILQDKLAATDALAAEAIEVVDRLDKHSDRLAEQLASQYLLNEELQQRVAWYRRMYHDTLDNFYINLMKHVRLASMHRLNGES